MFVQWGAGNIGRSFVGQLFSAGGYRVVFIDVNQALIDALNANSSYTVETVSAEGTGKITVTHVSAINGSNQVEVDRAIVETELMGVSVGKNVWPHIARPLAHAILKRFESRPESPLDIILAENIHGGKAFVTSLMKEHLPKGFPLETYLGLVETSIGKMVPLQDSASFLTLRAEPYNELIVNSKAFHAVPNLPGLRPVHPIEAYVDRKLFIHNLGHAAAAYLGYEAHPELTSIAEVLEDDTVLQHVREAMKESAEVLVRLYPRVFTREDLWMHIEDLLHRFRNPVLRDTVFRVGRDLRRKLRYDDRLMGIIIEAEKHDLKWEHIGSVYLAGLACTAKDCDGGEVETDVSLLQELQGKSLTEKLFIASDWKASGYPRELLERIAQTLSG